MRANKKAKHTILLILFISVLAAGTILGLKIRKDHTGETYYLQLTNPAKETGETIGDGEIVVYDYSETAYDKNGKPLDVTFSSYLDRPLREDAYLAIEHNDKNGVLRYQEIAENQIPEAALAKIQEQKVN